MGNGDTAQPYRELPPDERDWLPRPLDLSNGIPSHDRFNAAFEPLKPAEFEHCLLTWVTSLHEVTAGQLVAIDGKTLRQSFDKADAKSAIHMVSRELIPPQAGTS